jgi:hypothetical protein
VRNIARAADTASASAQDWYPTLCTLVGVPSADTIMLNGTARPIDGVDVWPILVGGRSDSPREYLPTTEHSIIWQGRWKLLTNASGSGWYPPALGYGHHHQCLRYNQL